MGQGSITKPFSSSEAHGKTLSPFLLFLLPLEIVSSVVFGFSRTGHVVRLQYRAGLKRFHPHSPGKNLAHLFSFQHSSYLFDQLTHIPPVLIHSVKEVLKSSRSVQKGIFYRSV